jgi:cAMP-dependent protein kinase regulator
MLSWFGGEDDVGILINKKKYGKAIKVLRQQLEDRPGDVHLRQRLADVLVLDGDSGGALEILDKLVDELAEEGFDAKAIAVLKKMQRIDPDRREVEEKLTGLIKRRDRGVWERLGNVEIPETAMRMPAMSADPQTARLESKLPVVQRSPLFATFSDDELLAVIRGLDLLTFEPGEIIVSESQLGDSMFIVAGGSVRVYVRGTKGANTQIRVLDEGEFFGEISLLSGQPRTATITAATPTELLELDRRTLDAIVVQHPQVPRTIKEVSARRAMSPEEIEARGGIDGIL